MFYELEGEIRWEDTAMQAANAWINSGMAPEPTYSRLIHYNTRRDMHVLKLAMISSISAQRNMRVEASDVDRAKSWLLDAEKFMPDVFRAMGQKSDVQVLVDLHEYVYALYAKVVKKDRKPIPDEELCRFLENKVPSDKIRKVIEMAEATGRIKRGVYPGTWIPAPLNQIGGTE
jgi:hypothetical protein